MSVEIYTTIDGIECVKWIDEQGEHSMLKSFYDEQQAAQQLGGNPIGLD